MSIQVRKTVRLGPLRFNVSKSGISTTVKIGPWSWNSRTRRHRVDCRARSRGAPTRRAVTGNRREHHAMCRSRAQGGRRCPGQGGGTRAVPTSAGPAPNEQVKADIRAAVERIAARHGIEWVGLAELREELSASYDRVTVDAALREFARGDSTDGMQVEQETNQKALTARDRAAAVRIGDRDQHVIRVQPEGPSHAERDQAAARQAARQAAVDQLRAMSDSQLSEAFAGATTRVERMSLVAEMARRGM